MIEGGKFGGNTKTGLIFEGKTDILSFLKNQKGYEIKENDIYFKNKLVASSFKKYELYKFLERQSVDWKNHLSKRLLPDDCIYVIKNNTLFIIEIKFQKVAGSTDEKLQTCDFKLKQYKKLFSTLNYEVEYIYILNDWFKKKEYKDVLDYIINVGCKYYFNYLPLDKIGLEIEK